ncbi:microtubule-associated proteins 1A/1B light chain 3C isoform X2 [Esox lucius]|uniref:Uncharacterized protein n=1 Tax=Esox lucius TaxID=8010 RepID=A0A3P8XRW5_ESOLU|nr:microtubule-associated proteins 1A/1B light chain 3C isoform X2 [Esox lucius]
MPPFEKSMELMPFKQRKCLATRKHEVCSIRTKFPNKLPVIVERYLREKTLPLLDKTKFLVPFELTLGQFLCLLRNDRGECLLKEQWAKLGPNLQGTCEPEAASRITGPTQATYLQNPCRSEDHL